MPHKSPEDNGSANDLHEVTIDRTELSIRGPFGSYRFLHDLAVELGYAPDTLLYRGTERQEVGADGRFEAGRETLWAFTDDEFKESARLAARVGTWGTDSPVSYALNSLYPALVLLDGTKLEQLAVQEGGEATADDELQYRARPGHSLHDALIAVINIED